MVTSWAPARRADLGLSADDLPTGTFCLTNREWYLLHRLLVRLGARNVDRMGERVAYIPTQLANHWGALLVGIDPGAWVQVGWFNGREVVPTGIVPAREAAALGDTHELTPLNDTPLHDWVQAIGLRLATTPTGLVISGQPKKGSALTTVNLVKGGKLDLTKAAGGNLTKVRIGLGWDARRTDGEKFDLDASVVACDANGLSIGREWFVFYNNLQSPGGEIVHVTGDNRTGEDLPGPPAAPGQKRDDEAIVADLTRLPGQAVDLRIIVTIDEAEARKQTFGQVENAFVRIVNEVTGEELLRYDLSEDTEPGVNALEFAKLYVHNGAWNFRALGDGYKNGLAGLINAYKIP